MPSVEFRSAMKSFWEIAHAGGSTDYLTGTSLDGHLGCLRASLPAGAGVAVLCIGVGTGEWVYEIAARDGSLKVWALDIAENVRLPPGSIVVRDPSLLPDERFDLAMSLWVSPHMSDEGLSAQVRHVVRSLTSAGLFAVHYNEPLPDREVSSVADVGLARAGSVTRRRKTFLKMVLDAGARADLVWVHEEPKYAMQMVVAHVRRTMS